MTTLYIAESLFDGQNIKHNQLVCVKEGKVQSVEHAQSSDRIDNNTIVLKGLLAPAYVDVQVNGGGGLLFNNEPTLETLKIMTIAHQQFGTGSMTPTLITDDIDVMKRAADAISQAIAQKLTGVVGVHFEGPHLSGPRKGIHPIEHIRGIGEEEMRIFTRKDLGQVCVTVAPECVSLECIKTLVSENVHVCLGHSNASDQQTFDALEAGAKGFTHLFNAMSPLQGRASGVVGVALLDNDSFCGLIADNEHVSINSCKLAIKCKSADKIMLVTDAMSHVGSEQSILPFAGMDITRTGDKLTIADGTLAGSALDMQTAVKNAVNLLGCKVEDALKMASKTPAAFLGLAHCLGQIAPSYAADWVLLDDKLHIQKMFLAGQDLSIKK